MQYFPTALQELADQFARLPGIGGKTAQRLAFYVVNMSDEQAQSFAKAILDAHEKIHRCSVCCNLSEDELCPICSRADRDASVICVVEDPRDVIAIERTHEFNGTYHVLGGVISPMDNIGPDQLRIKELLERINNTNVRELIIATNPNIEGEATAMYIARLIKPAGIKVTRIAHGIPVGGDLEYADEITLSRSLEGRNEL